MPKRGSGPSRPGSAVSVTAPRLLQSSGRSCCFAAGALTASVLTPLLVLDDCRSGSVFARPSISSKHGKIVRRHEAPRQSARLRPRTVASSREAVISARATHTLLQLARPLRKRRARPRRRLLLARSAEVGGPAWLVRRRSRREWTARMMCRSCGRARLWSGCFYLARRTRAARPRLGRGASCLADERARRKRARSVADAAPNVRRSAGPSDAIVSSTGMPAMCASGIIGRSPWCSRRPGGAPRGRGRGRWGGCGSRRRSRGRPASRRRASS